MSKIRFIPQEWTAPSKGKAPVSLPAPIYNKVEGGIDDVERITREIERGSVDIAPSYKEWCDLGFALAEGLGENGRSYYHRLSRLHSDYNQQDTDKQYSACLNSRGQGITIATFFHMARNAGVDIRGNKHFEDGQNCNDKMLKCRNAKSEDAGATAAASPETESRGSFYQNSILSNCQSCKDDEQMLKTVELPVLPEEVYDHLPSFLKDCVKNAMSKEDRATILLGTLACISACFHNVRGVYDGRPTYSNFYLFVVADAGMGKGALTLCGEIVRPVNRELHEISKRQMKDYKEALAAFAKSKGEGREIPEEPPMRMLIIPANSSASSFLKILSDNDGMGLMFETEADTLSQTLRSDYGNYSEVLRKAFQHEPVSQSRRKDREFIDVSEPCLSVVLSGTPEQVRRLIPDAENGLLSRFCFYNIPFQRNIRNVFSISDLSLSKNAIFRQLGGQFMRERDAFMRRGKFTFSVPEFLHAPFTDWLRTWNDECCEEIDNGMQGVIRRMGHIAFRIMMILTIVREFGNYTAKEARMPDGTIQLVCSDEDYYTAISIADTLIEHAKYIYTRLAVPAKQKVIKQKENRAIARRNRLFNLLPDEFTKADYDKVVADNNENLCTAGRWIDIFIRGGQLQRVAQGRYAKIPQQETEQKQICTNSKN